MTDVPDGTYWGNYFETEAYMFDRQAGELKELMKDEVQTNLKEIYDSIEQEDREHEDEFKRLKSEHLEIEQLLDSCLIPRKRNDREMSLTERFRFLVQRQGVLA